MSKPLRENKIKGNVKNIKSDGRKALPPPPIKTPIVSNKEIAEYKKNHELLVEFMYWRIVMKNGMSITEQVENFLKQRK